MDFRRLRVECIVILVAVSVVVTQDTCLAGWSKGNEACYLPMKQASEQNAAVATCRSLGGQLPPLTSNRSTLLLLQHLQASGVTSLWLPYRLLRVAGTGVIVVNEKNESTAVCEECSTLANELDMQGLNDSCIMARAAGWALANCTHVFQYACHADLKPERAVILEAEEIAAIICASFLVISIIVVFVVDVIKNPRQDDQIEFVGE